MPLRPARIGSRAPAAVTAGARVGELFEHHGRMVYALCRLILRDGVEAEDATQQTFLCAYRSLLSGGEPREPAAWLAAIARNECRARFRRRRPATVPLDGSEAAAASSVADEVEQREEIEALASALAELPPSQRDAVVLREFYGLSYAEVGAALGVTGPAVESLLFKGRRKLQARLGPLRAAGALALPEALRDALAQALPGFGGAAAGAAGAKIVAFPAAAKVVAAVVVLAGGGVTAAQTAHRASLPPTLAAGAIPIGGQVAGEAAFRPRSAWRRVVRAAPGRPERDGEEHADLDREQPRAEPIALAARPATPVPAARPDDDTDEDTRDDADRADADTDEPERDDTLDAEEDEHGGPELADADSEGDTFDD